MQKKSEYPVYGLKKLIKNYKLLDIWRIKHQSLQQYSWKRKNSAKEASRIDYFLIQPELSPLVSSCDIRPALIQYTDHLAVSVKLISNTSDRGPGTFKLNNSILENTEYQQLIENLINEFKNNLNKYKNIGSAWDIFKNKIREKTINFCKMASSARKNEISILERKLDNLQNKINIITENDKNHDKIYKQITEIENNLENLYSVKAKGAQVRSRIKWVEQGEKNTKYFLGLEKSRQTRKTITSLYNDKGEITDNQSEILQISKSYYENLYKSTNPNPEEICDYINETKITKKLTKKESSVCDGELSIDECTEAIFNMRLNRSPGYDGITVEFYRQFWPLLKDFIVDVFNYNYARKELTESQKLGMLTLIFKKNDPLSLSNYRPITLLNTDTKLIAYALANRLKKVLPSIISDEQTGYIKKRYIGFNIRQIQDIIDYAEQFKVDGAILFLDFTKAFDSIEWHFMFKSLEKFGFQKSILDWIQTLYTDIRGCVCNNGWVSEPYPIERGIRQGCPLSSLIFIIAVEIMATRIRTEENIRGFEIRLNGTIHSLTISQLADDTTLFLKSKNEISIALNIIEIFGNLSGLKLNRNKTEGIWLGRLKHCKEKFEDISWTNEIVKCLGVYFGHNKAKCQQANIEKQIQKSENIINSWNKRNLSLIGKITVVKSLILPNITFIASVCTIPPEYIQKF